MSKKVSALIISLVAIAAIFGRSESVAQSKNDQPSVDVQSVRTTVPEKAEGYQRARAYTGVINANRTSELSFLDSGRLEKVMVDEGQQVKKGQLLAILDTRALHAQRSQLYAQRSRAVARLDELRRGPRIEPRRGAQAQVRRAEADLRLEETKLRRRQELFLKGAIPKEDLDEIEARVAVLRANLETSRQSSLELDNGTRPEVIRQAQADISEIDASLQSLQVRFEDSELRAPFTGKVAQRLRDEGTIVAPGTAIFLLDEAGPKEAVIDLPADLKAPDWAELALEDTTVKGKLLAEPARIDPNSFTKKARYEVPSGLPGQPVSLELDEFVEEPGFWVPVQTLTSAGNGLWQCYSVGADEKVRMQQVEVLHRTGDKVLVRGTLQAQDRVIVEGVQSVVAGQQVAIQP